MKAIHKFTIKEIDSPVFIEMPTEAKILSVQEQFNDIRVWALIDDQNPIGTREIYIFGTGHEMVDSFDDSKYLGTVQTDSGNYVWHFFDYGYNES